MLFRSESARRSSTVRRRNAPASLRHAVGQHHDLGEDDRAGCLRYIEAEEKESRRRGREGKEEGGGKEREEWEER